MPERREVSSQILLLASTIVVVGGYCFLFDLFHRFDWGEPVVKVACFLAILVLLWLLTTQSRGGTAAPSRWVLWLEFALALGLAGWSVVNIEALVRDGFRTGTNDIGETTIDAIRATLGHENPYRKAIARIGPDPNQWGYKYGPVMMYGYALAGFMTPAAAGIKASNIVYLVISVGLAVVIGAGPHSTPGEPMKRLAPAAIAGALTLVPYRLHYELFSQGVIDMFPVMLVLASLAAYERGHFFVAGFMFGLSFAAKFAPAVFLGAVLVRAVFTRRFFAGAVFGFLPALPFFVWDAAAVVRNVYLFHGVKGFDTTSLYNVVPRTLHWIFPVLQVLALAGITAFSFARRPSPRNAVLSFMVLLAFIEITFREIHGNHLIWFIPFLALLLTWRRHGLSNLPARVEHAILEGSA